MTYFDVGGSIVTVVRLFSDIRLISKVKEEYIKCKLNKQLKNSYLI